MSKTSKPTRIMVSGPTVDGRDIPAEYIQEMADTYDPEVYAARVNCEHIDGITPLPNGQFPAYGTVVALSAEPIDIEVSGKKEQQLALCAVIDVNDQFLSLSMQDQKTLWSGEIMTNFRNSGKAYLTGLAITDTPACICTEKINLSKQPFSIDFDEKASKAAESKISEEGILKRLARLISGESSPEKLAAEKAKKEAEELAAKKANEANPADPRIVELADLTSKIAESVQSENTRLSAEIGKVSEALSELKTTLSIQPKSASSRENVTGKADPNLTNF